MGISMLFSYKSAYPNNTYKYLNYRFKFSSEKQPERTWLGNC